jgi:hypothetical protein
MQQVGGLAVKKHCLFLFGSRDFVPSFVDR